MSTRFRLAVSAGSCEQPPGSGYYSREDGSVGKITEEAPELVARVAALDIGKASLVACPMEGAPTSILIDSSDGQGIHHFAC